MSLPFAAGQRTGDSPLLSLQFLTGEPDAAPQSASEGGAAIIALFLPLSCQTCLRVPCRIQDISRRKKKALRWEQAFDGISALDAFSLVPILSFPSRP